MKFFQLIPPGTHVDFVGKFKYFLTFSILCLAAVIAGLVTKGLNYGIDFTGGTVMQVKFAEPKPTDQVRQVMAEIGEKDASVVSLGEGGREYLITTRTAPNTAANATLNRRLSDNLGNKIEILSVDIVGPKVGQELKWAALRSLFYTILFVTIYIWLRFDMRFAPGATVAMLHDLTLATGFYLVTGSEFTIVAVAVLLTIAGYSVNDTIVIYDRVRDMLKKSGEAIPLPTVLNDAINATLSRTALTAVITLISILPIAFFTTGELQNFAITMCFGIMVGAYSTWYIAVPFTIYIQRYYDRRNSKTGNMRPRPVITT